MTGKRMKDLLFVMIIITLGILVACSNDDNSEAEEQQRIADSIVQAALDNAAIDAYIESHGITNIITEESGIRYTVLTEGNGRFAEFYEIVSIHYIGKFLTDTVFDTSIEQVALANDIFNENAIYQPLTFNHLPDGGGIGATFLPQFTFGLGQLIPMMDLGSRAILFMPSAVGYGTTGDIFNPDVEDNIPPNTPLIFEFSMVNLRP